MGPQSYEKKDIIGALSKAFSERVPIRLLGIFFLQQDDSEQWEMSNGDRTPAG